MDFIDLLKNLSAKILKQKDVILTEEATKNAFVLPFISALGYDVFDPSEVIPEFTSDIGTKKGEKVDYAIMINNVPVMFFECKKCGAELDTEHASQLYRYFATNTKTRIGILTNGIVYQIYSDLEEQNVMDKRPFLEINLLDLQENLIPELKKITKSSFNLEEILSVASELLYMKGIKKYLSEQLVNPEDDFVKFLTNKVYSGVKTTKVMQMFTGIVKRSFSQFINKAINERLKAAMSGDNSLEPNKKEEVNTQVEVEPIHNDEIITTAEEWESYYIVKSILHDLIDVKRIYLRDFKNFCNIVLDDSLFKIVIRFYYHANKKQIGIWDENKQEQKILIEEINEIYNYSDLIKIALQNCLNYTKSPNNKKVEITETM